jgi:hypothetical protein
MTHAGKMLVGILGGLALCTGALQGLDADEPADSPSPDGPYQGIVDRNVFGLKPPPPPADPESTKPPLPKIYLTGITTFGGKRAFLKATPEKPKAGEAGKEQSYMLAEGQRDGDLEMLQIDEINRTVKVKFVDTIVPLDFTNNGAKPIAAPPPAPGPPGAPGGPAIPAPGGGRGMKGQAPGLPPRTLRVPGGRGTAAMGGAAAGYGGAPGAGAGYAPGTTAQTQLAQAQPSALTPEQQAVLMEAERDLHRNDPTFPPLPPTALTPLIEASGQEGAAAQEAATGGAMQAPPRFPAAGGGPPLPGRPF